LSDGRSDKFWEVSVDGAAVTVRFGRIGTAGQTQVKSLPDAVAACEHVEKLIGEKVGKGYVPVG
jgi:predicted DNA-binding WGR domain protein